jgi:hypothetical protein
MDPTKGNVDMHSEQISIEVDPVGHDPSKKCSLESKRETKFVNEVMPFFSSHPSSPRLTMHPTKGNVDMHFEKIVIDLAPPPLPATPASFCQPPLNQLEAEAITSRCCKMEELVT